MYYNILTFRLRLVLFLGVSPFRGRRRAEAESRELREPRFRHLSAQLSWKCFAEAVILHCKLANKHRGDLRRRPIRATTAQKHIKILARDNP